MTALVFIAMAVFISTMLEILAGAYGFWVPAAAWVVFYISVTYGWQAGLGVAMIQGATIDMLFCRDRLFSAIAFAIVVLIAEIWLHRADGKSFWMRALPGLFIGLICVQPQTLVYTFRLGWDPDIFLCSVLSCLFSIVLSVLMLPTSIAVLDEAAEHLGLPQFGKARENIIHRR